MDNLKDLLSALEKEYYSDLAQANTSEALEQVRIKYLGRQGSLSILFQSLKEMSLDDKKIFGPIINNLKKETNAAFEQTEEKLKESKLNSENSKLINFDVTAYKPNQKFGTLHPYTKIIERVEDIFVSMGFEIVDGPEVENPYHNFEALNIPEHHPARDMQDTFWLTIPGLLMRTHTSSVEVHTMKNRKPPIAVVAPGRCYRNEATDASHDFMFMQVEGLFIDKNVSMANLFATVKNFLQAIFEKKDLNIRIRPSYFPFVEPGVEIDMTCPFCTAGCSVCKKTKWIEICGAGLTHPNVLRACNIDPEQYNGFAFGFGLTRLVMLIYGITDIRLLHSNRLDFLEQF